MNNSEISSLLFSQPIPSAAEMEKKYAARKLPNGAMVTRIAPSPTGFMHIGTIYTALISATFARQSGGVFFLRIEDTDQKREVEGARQLIIDSLNKFSLTPDEGPTPDQSEKGEYGPYIQSQRKEIYHAFAKRLFDEGKAYPCFCTSDQLTEMTQKQESAKMRTGYYKQWAVCRNLPPETITENLKAQKPFVLRFKSTGEIVIKRKIVDLIKGNLSMPETDNDIVLLKSDGIPTYHFAHVIDDFLMGTTHVTRGDEWLASLPLHLQLFDAMGWKAPQYAHLSPIQKLDEGGKRKLSKRKDPEASVSYYFEKGYSVEAILEYLLNLADSGFEPWREQNPDQSFSQFQLTFDRLGKSGALLDFDKLNSVSRNYFSRLYPEQIYQNSLNWSAENNSEIHGHLSQNKEFWIELLGLEKNVASRRKDLSMYSEIWDTYCYFFDDYFGTLKIDLATILPNIKPETAKKAVELFAQKFDSKLDKDSWLNMIKEIATELGYAPEVKMFKQEPDKYKGHFGEITQIYRVLLTGRLQSPDLYEIMRVLGKEKVFARMQKGI